MTFTSCLGEITRRRTGRYQLEFNDGDLTIGFARAHGGMALLRIPFILRGAYEAFREWTWTKPDGVLNSILDGVFKPGDRY